MCGISGIINFHKKVNLELVKRMSDSISYRGPDHKTFWSNSFCAVGNVRLSIIDLSKNSNQPFVGGDNRNILVYNGEIYNYLEIKNIQKELNQKFHY